MEWDFSPDDVMEGKVDYSLEDFRADLWRQVECDFLGKERKLIELAYHFTYHVCFWFAVGWEIDDFMECWKEAADIPNVEAECREFIELTREMYKRNIETLRAIFQREILKGIKQGLDVDESLC